MPPTKPPYSPEFRQQSVDLLLSSGRPMSQVSKELGIAPMTLAQWRNAALRNGSTSLPRTPKPDSSLPLKDPVAEVRRLQREVDYLRRQRDILKKAMSILSEDPQSGMR